MYYFALITMVILTLRAIFNSKKAMKGFYELINDKSWMRNFLLIIVFCSYTAYKYDKSDAESEKILSALKKAILAFIIALLSKFDLTIAPFWLVFVLAVYLEDWI